MTYLSVAHTESTVVEPEEVARILDATRILEVRVDEVHAGPLGRLSEQMTVEVDVDEPQVGRADDENRLLVRLTHRVRVFAEGDPDSETSLVVSHIVTLQVTKPLDTTWPAVAAWIETNVYFLAYPYVRQSISSLTASMGMQPLVLGYLSREERPFTGVVRD